MNRLLRGNFSCTQIMQHMLSNFQVHRHIKAIPVVTYISSGWRPRPPPHEVYMSRLKPENNEDIRNVKRPTTEKTGTNTCPVTILIRPGLHRPEALGRWDCMEAAMAPDELMLSLLTQLCRKYLPKIGKSFSLWAPHHTYIHTYIHTNLYSAKIVRTNLRRWHRMTRR